MYLFGVGFLVLAPLRAFFGGEGFFPTEISSSSSRARSLEEAYALHSLEGALAPLPLGGALFTTCFGKQTGLMTPLVYRNLRPSSSPLGQSQIGGI